MAGMLSHNFGATSRRHAGGFAREAGRSERCRSFAILEDSEPGSDVARVPIYQVRKDFPRDAKPITSDD
jgi:hypothetical protein